ncbi:hypothetical protein CR513_56877, partial [Mucuna pruriens]
MHSQPNIYTLSVPKPKFHFIPRSFHDASIQCLVDRVGARPISITKIEVLRLNHKAHEEFHNIISLCSFAIWGMDILGPLPKAKGQSLGDNGQAEPTNKVILRELKKRMGKEKGHHKGILLHSLNYYLGNSIPSHLQNQLYDSS